MTSANHSQALDTTLSLAILVHPKLAEHIWSLDLALTSLNDRPQIKQSLLETGLSHQNSALVALAKDVRKKIATIRHDEQTPDFVRNALKSSPLIGFSGKHGDIIADYFSDLETKHGISIAKLEVALSDKINATTTKAKERSRYKAISFRNAFLGGEGHGFDFEGLFHTCDSLKNNIDQNTLKTCNNVRENWLYVGKYLKTATKSLQNGALGFIPKITVDHDALMSRLLKLAHRQEGPQSGLGNLVSNAGLDPRIQALKPNAAQIVIPRDKANIPDAHDTRQTISAMMEGGLNTCVVFASPHVIDNMSKLFSKFMRAHKFERVSERQGDVKPKRSFSDVVRLDQKGARASTSGDTLVLGFSDQNALNTFMDFARRKMTASDFAGPKMTVLDHALMSEPIVALTDGRMGMLQGNAVFAPIAEGGPKLTRHIHVGTGLLRELPVPMAFVPKIETPNGPQPPRQTRGEAIKRKLG